MKTIYALFIYFIFSYVQAQTLTQTYNEPQIGDKNSIARLDTSDYTSGMPIAQTGANQSWDFSLLKKGGEAFDTEYHSPASFTSAPSHTNATVVEVGSGLKIFMKSVNTPTTQTEIVGIDHPSFSATFTNSAIAAIYPMSFGDEIIDNISGSANAGTINANCNGKITTIADATGTLTLKGGLVYNNVIRLKTVQTLTFTQGFLSLLKANETSYRFFDMSEKFPVLTISYTSFALAFNSPTITAMATGQSKTFIGISENELNADAISIFPNPANGILYITLNEKILSDARIELYNTLGQMVKRHAVLNSSIHVIDVSNLSPGAYTVKLSTNSGTLTRKLILN